MKKIIVSILLGMCISLCACGTSDMVSEFVRSVEETVEAEDKTLKEEPVYEEPIIEEEQEEVWAEKENDTEEVSQVAETDEEADEETVAEAAETEETTEEVEKIADNDSNSEGGVTPEFKAAMDEYEAFYDEYCDFMKKYISADPASSLGMLEDYTKMLGRLDEMNKSLDEMGEKEMSTADYNYYIDVTARIEKKLLSAMQ